MKVTVEWIKEFVATEASAEEIGETLTMLGIELEGIEDSPIGPVLDFKVTPNRGDCLSVIGIARELAAKDALRFSPTELFVRATKGFPRGDENQSLADARVDIDAPDLCHRFTARRWDNVRVVPSSDKLQARLSACGMRPINVVVDASNYVMLELGQPLHTFDFDLLREKRIVVRRAGSDASFTTLDDSERKLSPDMLMICDGVGPVAIAGVMGGANSEVSESTTRLLLESAHFDPSSIRSTRKRLGMSTEASYRFERFVDPEGTLRAENRFAEILESETGVAPMKGIIDQYPSKRSPQTILVRESRWNMLLGIQVPKASAAASLIALGFDVREANDGLTATAPSWRSDIHREDDLVEEIGRLWGYERIPEALPIGAAMGGEDDEASFYSLCRLGMLRMGFTEVLNHTLCEESPLDIQSERVRMRHPQAPELALLRSSILPGVAQAVVRNRGRDLQLFEVGRVFHGEQEFTMLGFAMVGRLLEEDWSDPASPKADFFSAKGVIERLATIAERRIHFVETDDPRFHPGRRGAIATENEALGVFGEVLPEIAAKLDLPKGCVLSEIDLAALFRAPITERLYEPISHFPSVRRDFSMTISKSIPYEIIESAIRNAATSLAERIWPISTYEGKGIEPGTHALAVGMVLRHPERTLTDEEANEICEQAWQSLIDLGAIRR
jgi:phenylalanyl-tRNA synthetase beta chain